MVVSQQLGLLRFNNMKKAIQIGLIICVLGIWGVVIYRLIGNSNEVIANSNEKISIIPTSANKINYSDSVLYLDYPDPFLRNVKTSSPISYSSSNKRTKPIEKPLIKKEIKPEPEKWIDLVYKGLITNNKNGEQFGLVSILGSDLVVKKNDLISDTKIIFLSRDSIGLQSKSGMRKMVGR